jgi:hypothetical protein
LSRISYASQMDILPQRCGLSSMRRYVITRLANALTRLKLSTTLSRQPATATAALTPPWILAHLRAFRVREHLSGIRTATVAPTE